MSTPHRPSIPFVGYDGWFQIGDLYAGGYYPSYVSAVSRSTGKFDIFVAGSDGQVWTAASGVGVWRLVQPGVSDWHVFEVQLPYGLPAFP
jgi:hypothetical protein